ncbi:MAG: Rrf2 family transcriptional regulator [Pseudomonadaceae bacterium]|nr:Rrf2 family transcriptional regulator [Pseudomonadaceae bacterium]
MQFSTRGRYAIMAMLDLAEMRAHSDKPVTLAQIAERQRISLSYLEQLFAKLRKHGIVESLRGPGGGYNLARDAGHIWLAEIVAAIDEDIDLTRCKTLYKLEGIHPQTGCVVGRPCNAHGLWMAMSRHMERFLQRVSLQMVLDGDVGEDFNIVPAGKAARVEIH